MNEGHDPNRTVDVPSVPADSLDAGLAAGFGLPADGPGSVLTDRRSRLGRLQPGDAVGLEVAGQFHENGPYSPRRERMRGDFLA